MTNFSIYRKTTGTLKIPRISSGTMDIVRKTTGNFKIPMPQLLPAPSFVSAEVGLIDAYTLAITFNSTMDQTSIPDIIDLVPDFVGLELATDWDSDIYGIPVNWEMFTNSGTTISSAIANDLDLATAYLTDTSATPGETVRLTYNITLNSGVTPQLRVYKTLLGSPVSQIVQVQLSEGSNTYDITVPSGCDGLVLRISNSVGSATKTNLNFSGTFSVKKSVSTNVSSLSFYSSTVLWAILDREITTGEVGTISYIPGTNKLKGTNGGLVAAFTESVTNNVISSGLSDAIKAKLDFLWIGAFSGNNLLSDLDATVITVTGKDFTTTIPYTSAATLAVPNNATFIADDTDYIWFKVDQTQRQTTPLELVSYDLPRTLIKYEDTSPYEISRIAIIKLGATFTTAEWEEIYEYFHLPVFWDGTYNDYGYMKENRLNPEQYVWTPEDVVPNGDCTNLVATAVSYSEIGLTWDNGSTNEQGIKIERSLNGSDWTVIHTTAAGVESYQNTGLDENTLYYYRVRAYYGALYSNYSNTDSVTTPLNVPATITDLTKSVAWFKPSEAGGAVRDIDGNESVYWDMLYGSGTLGAEESSGNILLHGVYLITATQANFFYTGCQVGDTFACATVKTLSVNNKVQRYTGNHLAQGTLTKQPTNMVFNGTDNGMRTAAFTYNQPEMVYMVFKNTWVANDWLFDGYTANIGAFYTTNTSLKYAAYAGTQSSVITITDDTFVIVRVLFNGASSKLQLNSDAAITGNFGAANMGGFTLGCQGGTIVAGFSKVQPREIILRKVADSAEDEAAIMTYLKAKWSL